MKNVFSGTYPLLWLGPHSAAADLGQGMEVGGPVANQRLMLRHVCSYGDDRPLDFLLPQFIICRHESTPCNAVSAGMWGCRPLFNKLKRCGVEEEMLQYVEDSFSQRERGVYTCPRTRSAVELKGRGLEEAPEKGGEGLRGKCQTPAKQALPLRTAHKPQSRPHGHKID